MPSSAQAPDLILHIGAGAGDAAQDWLATGASALVLVEPIPAHHAALSRLAAQSDRIAIVEAALTETDGPAKLHLFNLASHNALFAATGLSDLLPGLRELGLVEVAGLSASSLLAQLGQPEGTLHLVIDAPGSELAILRSFAAAEVMDRVARIDLTCPDLPLYEGAASLAAIQDWLESHGFVVTLRDGSDPDFPRLTFAADTKSRQIADLAAELAIVQQALKASVDLAQQRKEELLTLRPLAEELRGRVEILQQDRDSLAATEESLKQRLAEAEAATKVRLAEAEAASKARMVEVEAAHGALIAEAEAAHSAQLAEAAAAGTAHIAALNAELAETKAALAAKAEKLDEVSAAQSDMRTRLDTTLKTEAAQAKRIKELEAAVIATRQSVAALKDEKAALTADLAQAQTAHSEGQAQLAEGQAQLAEGQAQLAEMQAQLAEMQAQLAQALGQVAELGETLTETRRNFAISQDQKRAALEELTEERKQRAALTGSLSSEKAALAAEISGLRQQVATLEAADKKSKSELAAKDVELGRGAERIRELEFRQNLSREDLRRAEGQVELIKDLLLRGDRL